MNREEIKIDLDKEEKEIEEMIIERVAFYSFLRFLIRFVYINILIYLNIYEYEYEYILYVLLYLLLYIIYNIENACRINIQSVQ